MRRLTIRLAGLALLLTLLAVPAVAAAQPAITVSPNAGAAGTTFVLSGTGFRAGTTVLVGVLDPGQEVIDLITLQVGANGALQARLESAGYTPGEYTVAVATEAADAILALGSFTVTGGTGGPTAPPRTGDGGMASDAAAAPWLAVALGLSLVAGAVLARRRRSR